MAYDHDLAIANWIFILQGVLMAGLGIPLALGKVPPNWFYGFRTPKTLSSPEIWYAANGPLGREMVIAGVVCGTSAIVVALSCASYPALGVFLDLGIMLAALAIVVTRGFVNLGRL